MYSEQYRTSVDKAGIKCCARICAATETDSKFLFSFPPVFDKKSRKRCLVWVKRAGNFDLPKYMLTELAEKFYLCSSHFSDWVASDDGSHRRILSTAVPVNFDFPPLSNDIINIAFSETSEIEKASARLLAEENVDESQALTEEKDLEVNKGTTEPKHDDQIVVLQEEESSTDLEKSDAFQFSAPDIVADKSLDEANDAETQAIDTPKSTTGINDINTESKKINDKLQNNQSISETPEKTNEVEPNVNRSSLSTSPEKECSERQIPATTEGQSSSTSPLQNGSEKSSLGATPVVLPDDVVVKKEVITDEPLDSSSLAEKTDKTAEEIPLPATAPPEVNTPQTPRKYRKRSTGDKRQTSKRKAKSDACDRLSGKGKPEEEFESEKKISRASLGGKRKSLKVRNPRASQEPVGDVERTVARSFIVSKDILSKLGSKLGHQKSPPKIIERTPIITSVYSNYQSSPEKSRTPVISNIRSLTSPNGAEKSATVSYQTAPSKTTPFARSVEPFSRTTGTQTSLVRTNKFLNLLDSDKKLSLFSGIPSFEVLENITDTTLKMVMSEAMRGEIQPTMREWIIITCTKFMLNISLEALAVMFELDEDECSRIVEKTSLFLRRTLSLPDGQKYVWSLPSEVLNGIADFSDGATNIG